MSISTSWKSCVFLSVDQTLRVQKREEIMDLNLEAVNKISGVLASQPDHPHRSMINQAMARPGTVVAAPSPYDWD